jgi:hypothetical protein
VPTKRYNSTQKLLATIKVNPQLDTLGQLAQVADLVARLEHEKRPLAAASRAEGCTWRQVADALNVTTQAAQQRYGGLS